MIQFSDSGPAINESDLAKLESVTGRPLPDQYRAFLLRHNGGRPTPDNIDIEGAEFKGTVLHTFFGVFPGDENNDLILNLESHEGCIENQLLPIAYDAFARSFILVLSEESYGHVYYFELTGEEPVPYFVANSFDEFLNKLREPTPEELATDD